jgi:hypothetical protein
MSRSLRYILLALIGTIAISLFLENLSPAVSVRFLGMATFPLPIGLAMLLAFGVGAVVAIPLNWLLLRAGAQGQQSVFARARTVAGDDAVIDVDYEDD